MKYIFALISLLFIAGCNKPEPNPELRDPIYADLNTRLGEVTGQIATEKKNLEGFQTALKEVVPQTGQVKFAQKRVNDSEDKLVRLNQEKDYLELKSKDRLASTKHNYLVAFRKGETWPDPKEYESYKIEQKLRKAKMSWDVKERMKEAGLLPDSAGPKKAAKKEE